MSEPDWSDWTDIADINDTDECRTIEFILADGTVRTGKLDLYDYAFNGEDEYPIWHVEEGGESTPMVRVTAWRLANR